MTRRMESKRGVQASAARAEKALATESGALDAAHLARAQRDETCGASEALAQLHTHPFLPRGLAYVLTCGQVRALTPSSLTLLSHPPLSPSSPTLHY
jgi:hypothetical protein